MSASIKVVVTSSTFIKSMAGFATGALLGFLLARGRGRSAPAAAAAAAPIDDSRSLYREPAAPTAPSLYKRCPGCGAVRDRTVQACDLCNYLTADGMRLRDERVRRAVEKSSRKRWGPRR